MIYIILGVISLVLVGGAICSCAKVGEKEGICKYDYKE